MKRSFAALLLAAMAFVALLVASVQPAAAQQTRHNVVFFNLDDLRDALPGSVDPLDHMPLTKAWFQGGGRRFKNSFVSVPSCCPSRAALMTGRFSHNNGVRVQQAGPSFDQSHSVACYLQAAGYRTYMAGKFLTTWPRSSRPPCFTHETVMWGGYWDVAAQRDGMWSPLTGYNTTALGVRGREYITEAVGTGAPFFLYETPQAPHTIDIAQPGGGKIKRAQPATADESYVTGPCLDPPEADRSDKPGYVPRVDVDRADTQALCESQIRSLREVDRQFDATMKHLKRYGLLWKTLVILSSDNGYLWGAHGRVEKFMPYEPSVRVPVLVHWPGWFPVGVDTTRLVSYLDIMPTILQATRTNLPAGAPPMDGESLLAPSRRTRVFTEYFYDTSNGFMPTWRMLRTSSYKFVVNYNNDGTTWVEEYYDLVADRDEMTNLLGDGNPATGPSGATLTQLRATINSFAACSGASCVN